MSAMPQQAAPNEWTCAGCQVTVSWMPDAKSPQLPDTWAEESGQLYCLTCRRDRAGDAGVAAAPEETPQAERQKLRASARVEFELKRDPDRPDGHIAQSSKTSIPAVRRARERLGIERH